MVFSLFLKKLQVTCYHGVKHGVFFISKEASTYLFIMESNMVFSLFLKVASTYLFIMESNMVFSLFLKEASTYLFIMG